MKKTYIIPEALVVSLSMCNVIAVSWGGDSGTEGLAKEQVSTDVDDGNASGKNVWDEEW